MSIDPAEAAPAPLLVVLGAGGQLGAALLAAARDAGIAALGFTRRELDITRRGAVLEALIRLPSAIVVNAAAYTAVDRAESEPALAFAVNRDGAAHVAEACAALDLPLLHVSTDYVFDGTRSTPYGEADSTAPLSIYGLSKVAGEQRLQGQPRTAIIRTSWLFGSTGSNFVKTILRLAGERPELRVVADQRGCPTAAPDLAQALIALGLRMQSEPALGGIFHYAGDGAVTWHDFAATILRLAEPRLRRVPHLVAITTAEYPTPARRPRNSVLACGRLAALGIAPRPWQPALARIIDEIAASHIFAAA